MTCRFVPTKQPKRETTLARLTRQGKAIERLMYRHNLAVAFELNKIARKIVKQKTLTEKGTKAQHELRDLYEKVEDLDVGYD